MGMESIHPLRAWRERHNPAMTRLALSKHLGVSLATVSRWETGIRTPGPKSLLKIRNQCGISPAQLRPDLAEIMAD